MPYLNCKFTPPLLFKVLPIVLKSKKYNSSTFKRITDSQKKKYLYISLSEKHYATLVQNRHQYTKLM